MIFKLCLVTILTILFGSVKAHNLTCDIGVFSEETKLDLPSPQSERGKCLVECMLKTNDMLGENGLIDVEKFEQSLKASKKIPDDVLPKLKTIADKCKDHRHNSVHECETAALFVQCASEESVKFGLKPKDMAKTIRFIYMYVEVEKRGIFVPAEGSTNYSYGIVPTYE